MRSGCRPGAGWRWAFDEAGGRALYNALWAGVGAWLLDDSPRVASDAVRPEIRVVPRSQPIRWVVPPATDSLRVTLHPLQDQIPGPEPDPEPEPPEPELREPREPEGQERAGPPGPPPAGALDTVVVATAGSAVQTAPAAGHYRYEARALLATGSGRRLRTTALPYLSVVLLLCAEWVLRRRWGLR